MNDRIALGAYQAAAEARLSIPDDLSVISFDDSDLAGWLRPGLTSAAIPHFELGRRAVERLLEPSLSPGIERVLMPLSERESVAPAPISRTARPRARAAPAPPPRPPRPRRSPR
ncbi:substrate-binding domain-containing protein [Nakamurella leprariae]|uniref:substrate-binding domain-containing protein n=1 Tax=Nakamurella leprariae TaxID=2803911 RepID=UPI0038B38AAD